MEMQITPKSTTGVERAVSVTVPAEAVAAAEERAARRYASSARLPGFRPGKAPAALVRKRFAEAIRNETIQEVVREAYREIMGADESRIASEPHIHDLKFSEGEPLSFEFHYEVRPTVELARSSGFRLERRRSEVTDDDVREQIERLREERATWTPIEERPREGDMVNVTLSVGDGSDAPTSEGRDVSLVLGDGRAIPGIEEVIMELAPGEIVERPVRWPDDFPDESQRGQIKRVRVHLKEVKRKTLPELDDAFARETGDFDSAAALTDAVRDDMRRFAEREAAAELRQRLIDEIIAANPFDVPRSWVARLTADFAEAYRIPEDQRAAFEGEFSRVAERQIKRDLIVEAIAEREKLTAAERDLDDRIAAQAESRGIKPGELYAALEKSGRLTEIERAITEDNVFRWLFEQNGIPVDDSTVSEAVETVESAGTQAGTPTGG